MKKFLYLNSGEIKGDHLLFSNSKRKISTNNAVILQYDPEEKSLSVVDLISKENVSLGSDSKINEALTNYVSKEELDEAKAEFVENIKGFFKIQGSCTLEELDSKPKVEGHWWQVGDKEYVWNGDAWVEVGFEISLEEYAKLTDLPTKVSELQNDAGYISDYTETDPEFSAISSQFQLKSEAFSKSYNDLTDKPEIPEIPSGVSAFANDAGYLTEHQDITGKADADSVYTKAEADNKFLTAHQSLEDYATKAEIANLISEELDPKFGEVSGQFALSENIPTKVSQLENDEGYLKEHQSLDNYATKAEISSLISEEVDPLFKGVSGQFATKAEIADLISEELDPKFGEVSGQFQLAETAFSGDYNDLTNKPEIPTKVSELENDEGYLKEHQDITGKADLSGVYTKQEIDNKFLTANQSLSGYATKEDIKDLISEELDPKFEEVSGQFQLAEEAFDGNYNSLSNKPEIPTKVSELENDSNFISSYTESDPVFAAQSSQFALKSEIPTNVSSFTNDAGYLTAHQDITGKADLSGVYTKVEADEKFLTEHQSLEDYATKADISGFITTEEDPFFAAHSGIFALKEAIPTIPSGVSAFANDAGYLTAHQSLEDYATKEDIANMLTDEADPIFSNALSGIVTKTVETFGSLPISGYTKTKVNDEDVFTPNGEISELNGEVITITGDSFSDNSKAIKSATAKLTNYNFEITGPNISTSKLDVPNGEESIAYKLFTVNIGSENTVSGMAAMAIGKGNKATGHYSFVHGYNTYAMAAGSHAEGQGNYAKAGYSHVEGQNTETNESYSHAEGYRAKTYAKHSHAEGGTYTFNGVENYPETHAKQSHAEGAGSKTYGDWSHAEGCMTAASGVCSHTEGWFTKAIGDHSHAEGYYCITSGDFSHAIGHTAITDITASGSFVEGFHTEVSEAYSHVEGKYNIPLTGYQHIVGGGTSDNNRKNIQTLDWNGNQINAGNITAKDFLFEGDDETLKAKLLLNNSNINNNEININYLITKLSKVIKEVDALKHEANVTINAYNPQLLKADAGVLSITDTNVDAIVTSDEIEGKTTLNVKSIEIDNSSVDIEETTGTLFNINAKEDVSITNTVFSSDTIDKSVDLIYLTSAEVFKLDGVTFSGRTYNTVMTGQGTSGKYLKYADIVNCNFNEFAQHFNIWFGGWQDNAVLNIKNCKFKRCEQFLCLGDYHGEINQFNNKLTINIENCEIEEYEVGESDQYSGIILCDSRNTTTTSQFDELNPFGNGKIIININNVTVGGVKLTKDNFKMGTKNGEQMLYVYQAATDSYKNISFGSDTKQFFPTVYVDGELITQLA